MPGRNVLAVLAAGLLLGLAACEKEGPMERAGEEVDEAVDSVREGGENAANRADDAIDEARQGAEEAAEEVQDR